MREKSGRHSDRQGGGKVDRLRTVGFLFSRDCNLDCVYCYVKDKRREVMPFAIAQKVITGAFNEKPEEYDCLLINILGAEPLLYFDQLKEIMEWLWLQPWDKPYKLHLTTNGTVLTSEMMDYLKANRSRIAVCVSYDGCFGGQESNRNAGVDLSYFTGNWPDEPVSMTISETSVPFLAENIIDLHQKNITCSVSCEKVAHPWKDESFKTYVRQLSKLAGFYTDNPDVIPCNLFTLDLPSVFYRRSGDESYCGAGDTFYVYDFDGTRRLCHRFSSLTLDEDQLGNMKSCFDSNEKNDQCGNCFLDGVCPLCLGMNYQRSGNPFGRDVNTCIQYTAQLRANCTMQGRRILQKAALSDRDKLILSALNKINTMLKTKPFLS